MREEKKLIKLKEYLENKNMFKNFLIEIYTNLNSINKQRYYTFADGFLYSNPSVNKIAGKNKLILTLKNILKSQKI